MAAQAVAVSERCLKIYSEHAVGPMKGGYMK